MVRSKWFGPGDAGVIVKRTRVVVAKSCPLTVTAEARVARPSWAADFAGARPVSTAVTARMPATATISTDTLVRRPRAAVLRRAAGTKRNRLRAAITTTAATTHNLTSSA